MPFARQVARHVGAWLICGLVAGLVLGIGGRLAMRLMAAVERQTTELSLEGTIIVLINGLIIGLASAALFVPIQAYTPGTGVWKGGLFGMLVMLLLLPILPPPVKDEIASATASGLLPVMLGIFGVLFILDGVAVQVLEARFLPHAGRHRPLRWREWRGVWSGVWTDTWRRLASRNKAR